MADTVNLRVRSSTAKDTATARDGSFDVVVPAGGSVAVTLARAGTIEVYCRYHPGMAVTLTVAK